MTIALFVVWFLIGAARATHKLWRAWHPEQ